MRVLQQDIENKSSDQKDRAGLPDKFKAIPVVAKTGRVWRITHEPDLSELSEEEREHIRSIA